MSGEVSVPRNPFVRIAIWLMPNACLIGCDSEESPLLMPTAQPLRWGMNTCPNRSKRPMSTADMPPIRLTEDACDWHQEFTIDHAAQVVRNVALAGSASKNGYRYSEQALLDAVPHYEHKPVFLDHTGDRQRPKNRSTRDLVGSICNVRYEEGRVRGDIRVLDTESGRTFLALVAGDAPGVGMSHVVMAVKSADGAVVEKICDVVSVDAVIHPATTTTFRESVADATPASRDAGEALTTTAADQGVAQLLEQLRADVQQLRIQCESLTQKLTTPSHVEAPPSKGPRSRERPTALITEDTLFIAAIRHSPR